MENKFVICVIFVFANFALSNMLEVPNHIKSHAVRLHNMCVKDTGVSESAIEEAKNGNIPSDRNMKCYLNCMFDKSGLIDEQKVIHLEHIIEVLPGEFHELVNKLVDTCGTKHGEDQCETAYLTVKCYLEVDPTLHTLIDL